MRKIIFPLAFVGSSTLLACSFQMKAGTGASSPSTPPASATQAATTSHPVPPPKPAATGPLHRLGKRTPGQATGPTPAPTSTSTAPAPTTTTPTTPPTSAPVVAGPTLFGSGTVDPAGFKGNLYFIEKGATKLPDLSTQKPAGFLFASQLDVAPQAFTTGFPGIDATRKENFAIRYEAPLVITTEADYDFRLVADDGAVLRIDNTPIVDNDGAKASPAEKTGPVHLVAGTHLVQVDYLQTTGNVALQLFWKKANDQEAVFRPGGLTAATLH